MIMMMRIRNIWDITIIYHFIIIVGVRVAYITKLAFLDNIEHMVTANHNNVVCSYL